MSEGGEWRCVGGVEEGSEETCNGRKRGGRGVVDRATTAFEDWENVSFVLREEFLGGVVGLCT